MMNNVIDAMNRRRCSAKRKYRITNQRGTDLNEKIRVFYIPKMIRGRRERPGTRSRHAFRVAYVNLFSGIGEGSRLPKDGKSILLPHVNYIVSPYDSPPSNDGERL